VFSNYSKIQQANNFLTSVKYSLQTSQNMVPDVRSSAHIMRSTAASQPISATSLVTQTTFVSCTVLQETHASCDQHSNTFQLAKP